MRKIISKYIPQSEFLRNVMTLMSGTAIAQAIPILLAPILSRLYSPDDFGILALFTSITGILGILASARYENAIVLEENENNRLGLLLFILLWASVISFLSLIVMLVVKIFNLFEFRSIYFMIPISVLFIGAFNGFSSYNNQKKTFKVISIGKFGRSFSNVLVSMMFGIYSLGSGLILGNLMGAISEVYLNAYKNINHLFIYVKNNWSCRNDIKDTLVKYKKFPLIALPSAMLNAISVSLPVIMLSYFFSDAIVGSFFQAHRLMTLPMSLIGASLGQVLFQKLASKKDDVDYLRNTVYLTFKSLLQLAILPLCIVLFFGEEIFEFILGEKWGESGVYAGLISPWLLIVFITSPIEYVILVLQKQKISLLFNIISVLSRFTVLLLGCFFLKDIYTAISLFSLVSFILWFFYLYKITNLVKISFKLIFGQFLLYSLPVVIVMMLIKLLMY